MEEQNEAISKKLYEFSKIIHFGLRVDVPILISVTGSVKKEGMKLFESSSCHLISMHQNYYCGQGVFRSVHLAHSWACINEVLEHHGYEPVFTSPVQYYRLFYRVFLPDFITGQTPSEIREDLMNGRPSTVKMYSERTRKDELFRILLDNTGLLTFKSKDVPFAFHVLPPTQPTSLDLETFYNPLMEQDLIKTLYKESFFLSTIG